MKQTITTHTAHTSAATSINAAKLPRVYNVATFAPGEIILDYGCGKYTDHIRAALPDGVQYLPYDPYNQPQPVNLASTKAVTAAVRAGKPVTVVCSNVLNVIDNADAVQAIADQLRGTARRTGGRYLVTVYEGDRSGNGRETMPDCWQRNEKTREYLRFFPGAHIVRGIITETF